MRLRKPTLYPTQCPRLPHKRPRMHRQLVRIHALHPRARPRRYPQLPCAQLLRPPPSRQLKRQRLRTQLHLRPRPYLPNTSIPQHRSGQRSTRQQTLQRHITTQLLRQHPRRPCPRRKPILHVRTHIPALLRIQHHIRKHPQRPARSYPVTLHRRNHRQSTPQSHLKHPVIRKPRLARLNRQQTLLRPSRCKVTFVTTHHHHLATRRPLNPCKRLRHPRYQRLREHVPRRTILHPHPHHPLRRHTQLHRLRRQQHLARVYLRTPLIPQLHFRHHRRQHRQRAPTPQLPLQQHRIRPAQPVPRQPHRTRHHLLPRRHHHPQRLPHLQTAPLASTQ